MRLLKVESIDAKLYSCSSEAFKMRFPKETHVTLRQSYEEKEAYRAERIEFLQNVGKKTRSSSTNQISTHLLDVRYHDLVNFASRSSKNILFNKLSQKPDPLLNPNPELSADLASQSDDINEKKKLFHNYVRIVEDMRSHVLKEYTFYS